MPNVDVRYVAEKMAAAYDTLASLTLTVPQRLSGALWEITMLEQHQDQLTEDGLRIYERIWDLVGRDVNTEERASRMTQEELSDVQDMIRDLFYDTRSNYVGE